MRVLKKTKSICPECFQVVDASIYEEDEKVFMMKKCSEHGSYNDLYWGSFEEFSRAQKYTVIGNGVENPQTQTLKLHPFDCGLCPNHKSHTSLAIIDVTNRCNLSCPICFANAAVAGYIYEPSKDQIREMIQNLRSIRPIPPNALQFSGGEPTVRDDLPDLIRMAKEAGFKHVEVNTNGIKLAESVDYCRKLLEAGGRTIYLQFDGVDPEIYQITRGKDLLDVKYKAIENCRLAGFDSLVLVPTIVKGVNDGQLGAIIKFAAENFDVIRCINFQPVSITGRINHERRRDMRITIPDCLKLIEEQTDGEIKSSDFYPVPVVVPISRAIGALRDKHYVAFTVHEHCGMATFLFIEEGSITPISHYLDVDKFINSMKKVSETALKGSKKRGQIQMILASLRYADRRLIRRLVGGVLKEGTYGSLGKLMKNILMIGIMHFQDPYNLDLERLERCSIHYAVPDGRIIPFCAMNTLYRSKIEREFCVPIKEWKEKQAKNQ